METIDCKYCGKQGCGSRRKQANMKFESVKSSNIEAIGYDEKLSLLGVQFKNKTIYIYCNVPKEVYDAFTSAESCGKYFSANVRDKYEYTKLELFVAPPPSNT